MAIQSATAMNAHPQRRFSKIAFIFLSAILSIAMPAQGVSKVTVSYGASSFEITDGGPGDTSSQEGRISFGFSAGAYSISVLGTLSKPFGGITPAQPFMDLAVSGVSSGAGELTITFQDDGWIFAPETATTRLAVNNSGRDNPFVTQLKSYQDATPIATVGPLVGLSTASASGTLLEARSYSLTLETKFTNLGGFGSISTDSSIQTTGPNRDVPAFPIVRTQPQNQAVPGGETVALNVAATGEAPLNYQWRKNGVNIVGANTARLSLNSVGAADSGQYSASVWNAFGAAESNPSAIAVLADGFDESSVIQHRIVRLPPVLETAENLVLVTHGVQLFWRTGATRASDLLWMTNMILGISNRISDPSTWDFQLIDWTVAAEDTEPATVANLGEKIGRIHGLTLAKKTWQHVHLIAHSAGAALIEAIAGELKAKSSSIHETFLDPYSGWFGGYKDVYGKNATWADNYFASDTIVVRETITDRILGNAFNVDVTWHDPKVKPNPTYGLSSSMCKPVSSHGWPVSFYYSNVVGTAFTCDFPYGFELSKEAGGWDRTSDLKKGTKAPVLCSTCPEPVLAQDQLPGLRNGMLNLGTSQFGMSVDGANVDYAKLDLSVYRSILDPLAVGKKSQSTAIANAPAWFAVAVVVTNTINFVEFQAVFAQPRVGDGMLSVYWNTNRIGLVDEGIALPELESFRFFLPATVSNGLYTLSFHLDAFTNVQSSVTVTNIATGYYGITEPSKLSVLGVTNGIPTLRFDGAKNFNYWLQTSSNLSDWEVSGVLINTNGTVTLSDFSASNQAPRFYRSFLPALGY
jgi:hypothetical protein